MPALTYSGSRRVPADDAGTVVPTLAENAVSNLNANADLTVRELSFEPGANGGVRVSVSVSIAGAYGDLSTLEDTLAQTIVGFGFESDAESAKAAMELQ